MSQRLQKLSEQEEFKLWDKAACGRHATRNDENCFDMTCQYCTTTFQTLRDLNERIIELQSTVENLSLESNEEMVLRERLAYLLTETANALHGGPMPNGSWSWHDLPELAKDLKVRLFEFEKPLPKNPLCKGAGDCVGVCGGCLEICTNLEFKLAHELVKFQEKARTDNENVPTN